MAWTREPTFSNTGSVISSIYRNWEDFSLNWDSLSPQEDFELIEASSSELITFGHEFELIDIDWEDFDRKWESAQFTYSPEDEPSGFSRNYSERFYFGNHPYHWEDTDVIWESGFAFDNEEGLDYLDFRFNEINFKFDRWDAHFGNKGSLWDGEAEAGSTILESGIWQGQAILWGKNTSNWEDFYPMEEEIYSGPILSVTTLDAIYGAWQELGEFWNTTEYTWNDFNFGIEDSISSTLSSTSNIVPLYDFNNLDYDWQLLSSDWNQFFLEVE